MYDLQYQHYISISTPTLYYKVYKMLIKNISIEIKINMNNNLISMITPSNNQFNILIVMYKVI